MAQISVVIPVYKAENSLRELYGRLTASLTKIADNYEILFIEDCGTDNSWDIIVELAKQDERVHGFKLTRNFGQHAATICGFSKASGRWIITMDDDLEQNPNDIPLLYSKTKEGYDLVYGIYSQRTHSFWRNVTSAIAKRLFRLAIPNLNYEYTSFRIIRRDIATKLTDFDSPFPFIDGYLSWLTNNYASVEVEHGKRTNGKSNYSLRELVLHMMNIFVTFSDLPLRIASWLGLATFFIGLLGLIIIITQRLIGQITVSGYTSLMVVITFFGGLQMLLLGCIGEYLGRINFKSSKKPLYLVGKQTESETQRAEKTIQDE